MAQSSPSEGRQHSLSQEGTVQAQDAIDDDSEAGGTRSTASEQTLNSTTEAAEAAAAVAVVATAAATAATAAAQLDNTETMGPAAAVAAAEKGGAPAPAPEPVKVPPAAAAAAEGEQQHSPRSRQDDTAAPDQLFGEADSDDGTSTFPFRPPYSVSYTHLTLPTICSV